MSGGVRTLGRDSSRAETDGKNEGIHGNIGGTHVRFHDKRSRKVFTK
jgi:hypothetical protein